MKSAVPRPPPRPPPGTAPPRPDRPAPLLPQASAASTTVPVTGPLQLKPKMPERPENAVWNPCGFQPVYGDIAQNSSGEGSAEVEEVPATATSAPRANQQDATSSVPDSPRTGKETVTPSVPCTPPRHPRLANPISSPPSAAKSPPTASMTTENMKLDTTKPYHKWSTDELKEYARRRRLPQIEEMSRDNLMANHRIVDGWDGKKTFTELEALAKVQGCPVRPGSTRESLMTDLMNHTFGGLKEKPPVAASSKLAGTTSAVRHPATAADRAKSAPPPHSAERSDDTLAAEVRRILNAKDNREVLGFAFGERSTLQEARSRYKKLALQLHSDKRTETGIAKACLLYTSPSPRD